MQPVVVGQFDVIFNAKACLPAGAEVAEKRRGICVILLFSAIPCLRADHSAILKW